MVKRWGTAVLALAIFATPLAAQEPSIESPSPAPVDESLPEDQPEDISEEPVEEASAEPAEDFPEDPLEDPFEDEFAPEPMVDVTELRAAVAEILPTEAPPPPAITHILPVNTPAAMIVNTRQETWSELNPYALFSQLTEAFGVPPSPQALPLLPYTIDYVEDVQPWIGDGVAIALLPIPSIRTIAPVERSVTIVPISDAAAFVTGTVINVDGGFGAFSGV